MERSLDMCRGTGQLHIVIIAVISTVARDMSMHTVTAPHDVHRLDSTTTILAHGKMCAPHMPAVTPFTPAFCNAASWEQVFDFHSPTEDQLSELFKEEALQAPPSSSSSPGQGAHPTNGV
jgi:hypothetical protein